MGKIETKYKVGIIIVAILSVLGLAKCILSEMSPLWSKIVCVIMYLLIAAYTFIGYKKPHGNMLKYLYLLYACSLLASLASNVIYGTVLYALLTATVILIVGYIAGRLDRIGQNRILMLVVLVIELYIYGVAVMVFKPSLFGALGVVSPLIMWIDLCVAYLTRYKLHKLAGLVDEPKN